MEYLNNTIKNIEGLNTRAVEKIEGVINQAMKKENAWGDLGDLLRRYVGITGQELPSIPKKLTVIACADHGVAEMNVSAYPQETTAHMVKNYVESKGAVANAMSNFCGSDLIVIDMGVKVDMSDVPNLIQHRIDSGTKNIAKGPAMSQIEAIDAINFGIKIANEYAQKGYNCFLPGEMGIANTTSSAAIVATICKLTPEEATGRGTNISDERLINKINVVRQALEINDLQNSNVDELSGVDILAKVGGFELGCITGLIIGAAANKSFVVLDGFNTGAAALIAQKLYPNISDYLMGSHIAAEPAHKAILEKLNLKPYMNFNFRLGEATGSSIAVSLLDCAINMYRNVEESVRLKLVKSPMPSTVNSTKKEFNIFSKPLPSFDEESARKCEDRIDNLTKPIYSLGDIEKFAIQIAGIEGNPCPTNLRKRNIILTTKHSYSPAQHEIAKACSSYAGSKYNLINVESDFLNDDLNYIYFKGLLYGESIKDADVVGITFTEENSKNICGTFANELKNILYKENSDELKYNLEELFELNIGSTKTRLAFAIGLICGAVRNNVAFVIDDIASEIAIKYAIQLNENISKNIFKMVPKYLDLNINIGCSVISSISMKILDASMQMMKDMKTFAEAGVAIANDGPGKGVQRNSK